MSLIRKFIAVLALVGIAGAANASYIETSWTSTKAGGEYIGSGASYGYQHVLNGFTPGSDLVTDFLLTIKLTDDRDGAGEASFINIPGLLGDSVLSFHAGNASYSGWSIAGLVELNLLGSLSVTITSLYGDFMFGGSKLVANGYTDSVVGEPATSVPEPATLGLLGMGLLGVGFSARRRKNARG